MAVDMDLKNEYKILPMGKEIKQHINIEAFKELHEKLLYASQQIKVADLQIDTLRRTKQHNILTKQELEKIPKDVNTYEALGRAFVLTPREEVFKNLDRFNIDTEKRIIALENSKSYLEGNLKESEKNLREMVQRKRGDAGGDKENQPSSSKD